MLDFAANRQQMETKPTLKGTQVTTTLRLRPRSLDLTGGEAIILNPGDFLESPGTQNDDNPKAPNCSYIQTTGFMLILKLAFQTLNSNYYAAFVITCIK